MSRRTSRSANHKSVSRAKSSHRTPFDGIGGADDICDWANVCDGPERRWAGPERLFWSVSRNCTVHRKGVRRLWYDDGLAIATSYRCRPGHMPNPLHLYDNYTRSLRPFEPLVANG